MEKGNLKSSFNIINMTTASQGLLLCLIAFSCVVGSAAGDESKVLVLTTEQSILAAAKENRYLMVEFYAPWCGHCQRLAPEYDMAAEILAEEHPTIKLAKVDADAHKATGSAYGVKGFPTIKWFEDGELSSKEVNMDRNAAGIVRWIVKHSDSPPEEVVTHDSLFQLIDTARFVAVAYLEKFEGPLYKTFSEVSSKDPEISEFVVVRDADVMRKMGATAPSVVFYSKAEEKEVSYKGAHDSATELRDAVRDMAYPTVLVLNDSNDMELFEMEHMPKIVLLQGGDKDRINFGLVAQKFKTEYSFLIIEDNAVPSLRQWLAIGEEGPQIYIIHLKTNARYRLTGEISESGITAFVEEHKKGSLSRFYRTDPVVDGWDAGTVKTIVGSQFHNFVNQDAHVLAFLHTRGCRDCIALKDRYNKAAEYFDLKYGKEVMFGLIDVAQNEIPDVKVDKVPQVWLFPKGKKGPPFPIDLTTQAADVRDLVKMIRKACEMPKEEREMEAEYEAAARRFKLAVRKLPSTLKPAVEELTRAAAALEALV